MQDKLARRFDRLDTDRNGYIERADYEAVPRRLAELLGGRTDAVKKLEAAYLALWDRLRERRDFDDDRRVSEKEFVSAAEEILNEGGYDRWVRPIVDAYIEALDTDGDGQLSPAELAVIAKAAGVTEHEAMVAFQLADVDGNGFLSPEELHQLVKEFYSSNPEAAANMLSGGIGI